jgi:hypothetical protein
MNRLLAAAIAAGTLLVALVVPSGALASCGGGPSASNVYKECIAGGGHHKQTGGGNTSGPNSSSPTQTLPISPQTARALKHAGKERRVLSSLVHRYAVSPFTEPSSSGSEASSPTAIGSAFDLGSGPTALLLVLAGTAVVLLGGSGMRVWRGRHRQ